MQDEWYPTFTDRERTHTNADTVHIPRWAAVKYDADARTVKLMKVGDSATLFAGVALEPIVPGGHGRILRKGNLHRTQMLGLSAATIALGTSLSLSSTVDGQFETSNAKPIGTGLTPEWATITGALL